MAPGSNLIGTVWMVTAALFYGGMSISLKLSLDHLTVWQTGMGRFVLGLALLPLLVRWFKLSLWGRNRALLLLRGLSGTLVFLFMIQAFKTVPLSVAIVLFYLWPVFACILSPWVAGEPTTRREWPFIAGALAGTVLILLPGQAGSGLAGGHFLALAAAVLAGLDVILIRRLGRTNNSFSIYFYFCLIGGLSCLGPLLAAEAPLTPVSAPGWVILLAVAVLSMAAQLSMNQGIKYLTASKTGVLLMIEVVVASTFGVVCLGETLTWRLLAGTGLILGCGAALILLPAGVAPPGRAA
ncbi:MAG: DMT family transporter [Deltaproteobacteria bacterium]|nr:DMT family transporter [Deltaproteobacteria bacterium]